MLDFTKICLISPGLGRCPTWFLVPFVLPTSSCYGCQTRPATCPLSQATASFWGLPLGFSRIFPALRAGGVGSLRGGDPHEPWGTAEAFWEPHTRAKPPALPWNLPKVHLNYPAWDRGLGARRNKGGVGAPIPQTGKHWFDGKSYRIQGKKVAKWNLQLK